MECILAVDGGCAPGDPSDALSRQFSRIAACRVVPLKGGTVWERLEDLARWLAAAVGPVVLVDAGFVGHDSALVDVVADPRPGCAVLVGAAGRTSPARVVQGVVVSGSSSQHDVSRPTTSEGAGAGGVLRVAQDDTRAAAEAVGAMAEAARVQAWTASHVLPFALVALVRSGIRVNAVPLRGFVASIADDEREREAVRRSAAAVDEHATRLRGAAREADGFYSTFVVRRLSRPLTAVAVRWGLSPNQVTAVALVIAAAAAASFAVGARAWLLVGAVLLQVSLVVDCVDGEVARYTRQHSQLGAWLDASTDRFKEFGVYAALAVGAARSGDSVWLLAASALALQVTRHFVDFGFAVRQGVRTQAAIRPVGAPLRSRSDSAAVLEPPSPGSGAERVGQGATDLSERTNRVAALVWLKRIVIMPIGERWLVISVATVASGPRLTFLLLLGLGAIAATYTTVGRVLRSQVGAVDLGGSAIDLAVLTDLGPLRLGAVGRYFGSRLGWLAPAVSRATEYTAVTSVTALVADDLLPLAYGYLFVLTMWHYDSVYRVRFIGTGPSRRAENYALGAPLRISVIMLGGAAGPPVLTAALIACSVLVLAVTVADSSRSWHQWLTGRRAFTIPPFHVTRTP